MVMSFCSSTVHISILLKVRCVLKCFVGFYKSLQPPRTDVDIDHVARCCLTESQPGLMVNASLAVFDCSCLEEKQSVAATLDLSGEMISVCTEEFPPLVRSADNNYQDRENLSHPTMTS